MYGALATFSEEHRARPLSTTFVREREMHARTHIYTYIQAQNVNVKRECISSLRCCALAQKLRNALILKIVIDREEYIFSTVRILCALCVPFAAYICFIVYMEKLLLLLAKIYNIYVFLLNL